MHSLQVPRPHHRDDALPGSPLDPFGEEGIPLVDQDGLDAAVESWLASLLRGGPKAIRIQKRLIMDWDRMGVTDGARAGVQAYVESYRSDEPNRP